jgi:hypothetical protein
MRKASLVLLLIMASVAARAQETIIPAYGKSDIDWEKTRWVSSVMDSILTIKPGMTRRDLLDVFMEEGGLSTRKQRTYVFRQCPYIKVDVEFSPVGSEKDLLEEKPEDKITKISRPYLQYSIMD